MLRKQFLYFKDYMKLLTQNEAERLIKSRKVIKDNRLAKFNYPIRGGILEIEVIDEFKNEYIIGIRQRKIELVKRNHNLRYAQSITLIRIDYDQEHCNPDGIKVGIPHIHVYKEDFNDKFAYALEDYGIVIENYADIKELLNKFLTFINADDVKINTTYQMDCLIDD